MYVQIEITEKKQVAEAATIQLSQDKRAISVV